MGIVRIELLGSFWANDDGSRLRSFSASDHGHADAIAQAIAYLASEALPNAIRLDHELHGRGEFPDGPFGRLDAGGPASHHPSERGSDEEP